MSNDTHTHTNTDKIRDLEWMWDQRENKHHFRQMLVFCRSVRVHFVAFHWNSLPKRFDLIAKIGLNIWNFYLLCCELTKRYNHFHRSLSNIVFLPFWIGGASADIVSTNAATIISCVVHLALALSHMYMLCLSITTHKIEQLFSLACSFASICWGRAFFDLCKKSMLLKTTATITMHVSPSVNANAICIQRIFVATVDLILA